MKSTRVHIIISLSALYTVITTRYLIKCFYALHKPRLTFTYTYGVLR